MKIKENGNTISIITPYNTDFVQKIKAAGGRWDAASKAWSMDARDIGTARAIMREVYGCDDQPTELVSVRVTFHEDTFEKCGPVTVLGRTVASAFGRDSGAKVGDGVCFEAGKAESGGSAKNWLTRINAGTVVIIHDVPKAAAETASSDVYTVDIISAPKINAAELEAEKEKLFARIAEIDAILASRDK